MHAATVPPPGFLVSTQPTRTTWKSGSAPPRAGCPTSWRSVCADDATRGSRWCVPGTGTRSAATRQGGDLGDLRRLAARRGWFSSPCRIRRSSARTAGRLPGRWRQPRPIVSLVQILTAVISGSLSLRRRLTHARAPSVTSPCTGPELVRLRRAASSPGWSLRTCHRTGMSLVAGASQNSGPVWYARSSPVGGRSRTPSGAAPPTSTARCASAPAFAPGSGERESTFG